MKKITIGIILVISLGFVSCKNSVAKPSYDDLEPLVWIALDKGLILYSGLGFLGTLLDPNTIFSYLEESLKEENNGSLSEKQIEIIKSQINAYSKLSWFSNKKAAQEAYKKLPVSIYSAQALKELLMSE
jgi:hypothetical protein